jgi:L-lactate utilization protein LutC
MKEALFIQKIRSALSRYSTEEEARVLASEIRPQPGPQAALEERIKRFTTEAEELPKVQVFRVEDWPQARKKVGQMLSERGVSSIALAGEDLKPSDPLWKKWKVASDLGSIEKAEVGVVQADYGLAQTGSIVLVASPRKPRAASLLPPVCYFVLSVFDMLESMAHLMVELEERHKKGEMPSAVNVVTGPSRTADIELSLTVGVHGPGEVHVILVG